MTIISTSLVTTRVFTRPIHLCNAAVSVVHSSRTGYRTVRTVCVDTQGHRVPCLRVRRRELVIALVEHPVVVRNADKIPYGVPPMTGIGKPNGGRWVSY